MSNLNTSGNEILFADICGLIEETRKVVACSINGKLTELYWNIGKRISEEFLKNNRAKYGKKQIAGISHKLTLEYGKGFGPSALMKMVKLHECFPNQRIMATLWPQLSWSHFRVLIPIKNELKRDFYSEMCRIEGWSVRTLRSKVDSILFERTALSKKPEFLARAELDKLRSEDLVTPSMVFKDPYILDFLGINDRYMEKDLEDAILRDMENFLLEMGAGFTFMARQKRIVIDNDDFYIDLVFYNRILQRLVCVDLKLGSFKPGHKGQMELYLRWMDQNERRANEKQPLGIILCAGKKQNQIELLQLGRSGIHVAEYLTVLPPREAFQKKLYQAMESSRLRLSQGQREK